MSMMKILQTIKTNKRFLISTHVNPDPDALCSELALAVYLRSLGKTVSIINDQTVPSRYQFLSGIRRVKHYQENKKVTYDVAIVVDCGEFDRIGRVGHLIQKDKALINIDHHITNDLFGSINLVRPRASSTTEVLYELLTKAQYSFTKDFAIHLYTGIVTDTGSFRYENTTARTHAIASELIKFNFSVSQLYKKLYETVSYNDLKELTKVISRSDMYFNKRVVCVALNKKMLSKFSGDFDLRDTIFKFLRSMKNVDVVIIFTEIERNKTRVNLRSSDKFDVAKLADYFNGGGHHRASGCVINDNIARSRKKILNRIRKVL
jgi:phosphoesterase RecJ-like protein